MMKYLKVQFVAFVCCSVLGFAAFETMACATCGCAANKDAAVSESKAGGKVDAPAKSCCKAKKSCTKSEAAVSGCKSRQGGCGKAGKVACGSACGTKEACAKSGCAKAQGGSKKCASGTGK